MMSRRLDLENQLREYAGQYDREFATAVEMERRIIARIATTPRMPRQAPTLRRELAFTALFLLFVALLAVGIGRIRALHQVVPAHPSPSVPYLPEPSLPPPGASRLPGNPSFAGSHRVTGTVFETVAGVRRPMPNVGVAIFAGSGSQSLGLARGDQITTDADGQFVARDLGDSFFLLTAHKAGYVQPRAATVTLRGDAVVDIELVAVGSVSIPNSPSPADSPTISGVVYETTPDGRRPVSGADVFFEWLDGVSTASTITDASGRYWLGRLPSSGFPGLYASKSGYGLGSADANFGTKDVVVDLELKRGP